MSFLGFVLVLLLVLYVAQEQRGEGQVEGYNERQREERDEREREALRQKALRKQELKRKRLAWWEGLSAAQRQEIDLWSARYFFDFRCWLKAEVELLPRGLWSVVQRSMAGKQPVVESVNEEQIIEEQRVE